MDAASSQKDGGSRNERGFDETGAKSREVYFGTMCFWPQDFEDIAALRVAQGFYAFESQQAEAWWREKVDA